MFEDSATVDPAVTLPALATAVAEIPLRPEPGGTAAAAAAELLALIVLGRQVEARIAGRVASFDAQGFAFAAGAASTAAWLRAYTRLDPAQATRLVAAARLADTLPAFGAAFAAGVIGVDHVAAVAAGAPRVPEEALTGADATFTQFAGDARPSELRRVAARLQACYDEDTVTTDAAHVAESRYLTLSRTFGDGWHISGLLEPVAGAQLAAALDSLTARRGPEDHRSAGQRRADALIEMTDVALRAGKLPDSGGDRPRITLLLRPAAAATTAGPGDRAAALAGESGERAADPGGELAEPDDDAADAAGGSGELRSALGDLTGAVTGDGAGAAFSPTHPGIALPAGLGFDLGAFALPGFDLAGFNVGDRDPILLGNTALLPVETITRISCDADVNTALLDDDGNVLNYGLTRRDPTPAQRRALVVRDQGCVFPGCDRPPAWCQAHHLIFWHYGGHTDLDNLALVCSFHHHLIHEHHWTLRREKPTPNHPHGAWLATAPDTHQLRQHRKHAA
jgi:Domain of unknown function (DUF222)